MSSSDIFFYFIYCIFFGGGGVFTVNRDIFSPVFVVRLGDLQFLILSLLKHNCLWANSRRGGTVCKCKLAKITQCENNPVYSTYLFFLEICFKKWYWYPPQMRNTVVVILLVLCMTSLTRVVADSFCGTGLVSCDGMSRIRRALCNGLSMCGDKLTREKREVSR